MSGNLFTIMIAIPLVGVIWVGFFMVGYMASMAKKTKPKPASKPRPSYGY